MHLMVTLRRLLTYRGFRSVVNEQKDKKADILLYHDRDFRLQPLLEFSCSDRLVHTQLDSVSSRGHDIRSKYLF